MSSSSSSEDLILIAAYYRKKRRHRRRWWVHPLNERNLMYGSYSIMRELEDEEKFCSFYRMSRKTFSDLATALHGQLRKKDTNFRLSVGVEEKLLITLRYLATGSSFRALSLHFFRGESTIGKVIKEVCKAIWETLSQIVMPIPDKQKWLDISKDYYKLCNVPNCVGSIDGKHIRLSKPVRSGSAYYNYKGYFSIVLMACVDANGLFVSVDVGDLGRNSDGGVFAHSNFGRALKNNALDLPEDAPLPGEPETSPVPFFFIGDEAFPLKKHLMRPYPMRGLTDDKRAYNYRICRARKSVECAFGMMRSKFRFLDVQISCDVDTADDVVKAACVLHNFIRVRDGTFVTPSTTCNFEDNHGHNVSNNYPINRQVTHDGKADRELLTQYFMKEYTAIAPQFQDVL